IRYLRDRFADESELPKRLCRIAYKYEQAEALEQAKSLNTQIAADFAGTSEARYAGLQLAKLKIYDLIDSGDYKSAAPAVSKMTADFTGNENLPRRLWEVANRYDKTEAFEYAKALSIRIAADYPKDEYAKYASLLLEKLKICEFIDEGKYETADIAISIVRKDFAGHKQIARRLWEAANRYDKVRAYKSAAALSAQIAEDYPRDEYAGYASLLSAKLKVFDLINADKYESADLAVSMLEKKFAGHKQLSRRLFEIARQYGQKEALANAKTLAARIAKKYPDDKYGSYAAIYLAKWNIWELIGAGNFKEADAAVSKMKTDFSGHPLLSSQLESITVKYESAGQVLAAQEIYRQMIRDFPDNDESVIFAKAQLKKYEIVPMMESGDYAAADAASAKFGDEFVSPQNRGIAMFYLIQGIYENAAVFPDYLKQVMKRYENEVVEKIGRGPMQLEAYLIASAGYQRLGNYSKAITYYDKILNGYSEYEYCWHIQFMVGQSYDEMLRAGQMTELQANAQIESAYRKVLKNYPDCKAANQAKKWLIRNGKDKAVD
ncbi:MAG: hypothetical protein PHQ00_01270, partial [Phycisphaerae bacterium]|nr:hypothetical protein [Phycisphaerae bacterium]